MVSFVALCFLVRSVFFYYPPSLQRIVTLYHINIAQASVFSNSSYILINATRGRRKMLPERIAAFAWIQSTPVTLLDESLEGKNFSPMWSWAHHQVILWNTIWVRLRSVIEIKVVDAAKSRGVVTPEFCWLFNDTQSLIYAVVSSLQLGYNSWVLLEFTLAWSISFYGPQCLKVWIMFELCSLSWSLWLLLRWWWKVGTGLSGGTCRSWTGSAGMMDWISTDWHPLSWNRSLKKWMQVWAKYCWSLFIYLFSPQNGDEISDS